jgi:hypothetical protein
VTEIEVLARFPAGWREIDAASDADGIISQFEKRPIMRFRLTYDGELKASGANNRAAEKWVIRRQLHPQLAELWEIDPVLNGAAMAYKRPPTKNFLEAWRLARREIKAKETGGSIRREERREALRVPIDRGGHNCIPIVRSSLFLTCSLDILFLRKEGPGSLVSNAGDLDNRIKTLFDGLRMPSADEGRAEKPEIDPIFCLLEDDSLITDLVIRTDRLLTRPDASPSEVRLIIDVLIHPTEVKVENSGFLAP